MINSFAWRSLSGWLLSASQCQAMWVIQETALGKSSWNNQVGTETGNKPTTEESTVCSEDKSGSSGTEWCSRKGLLKRDSEKGLHTLQGEGPAVFGGEQEVVIPALQSHN